MLPDNAFLAFVLVFLLRVTDVSLGTMRTVYILQGRRLRAAIIGFFEVLIWIFVVSQVVAAISDWILMIGYAGGFATGTWTGLWLENRFAIGFAQLRIISRHRGEEIAARLWEENFGASIVHGHGRDGEIDLIFSIVQRRNVHKCVEIANTIDKDCFVSISDSRYLFRGYMGGGMRK
jgi:uncharacterized protein YebE (UPF0316 family)